MAIDNEKVVLGTSRGAATQRDAIESAITDCEEKGGEACKILLSIKNGCLAMAAGVISGLGASGTTTKQDAHRRAMKRCEEKYKPCHLYYSHCDFAERSQ